MEAPAADLDSLAARVRAQVQEGLSAWLADRVAEARARGADVGAVAQAVMDLALRGGKRLRAVLLAAAYHACEPCEPRSAADAEAGAKAVVQAGMALELLQVYLLVHDDWIDGDDVRRGGPSVPAMMRGRFEGARADAMSVLAGDLAAAWAQRALLEIALPAARVAAAARELARMQDEVVQGQILDVAGEARDPRAVEAMHDLKTASYTVRGPVAMGASLAGASQAQLAELAGFSTPLGVAFQLRDDVLGVFGDAVAMGKATGSDLRAGKHSAVVVEALRDPRAREVLAPVIGRPDASDEAVAAAVRGLEASGVRARVEARVAALVEQSRGALEHATISPGGRALLGQAAVALTERRA
jgi:geranylgeranyl diphosphate synthase type I